MVEMSESVMTRSAALAALAWWRDAGVDTLVDDAPRDWLAVASSPERVPSPPGRGKGWADEQGAPVQPVPPRERPPLTPPRRGGGADLAALTAALAACNTLEALRQAVETIRTRPIFADGDSASGVMIVGETAAPDDDSTGKPFSGPAGALLDKMLAAIGRDRSSTYISNLLLWRGFGQATAADIATGAAILRRHIELAKPRAVLVMSGVAAKALLDTNVGITQLRGHWVDQMVGDHKLALLPTFNPAYLLRYPAHKRMAWADLLMFKAKIDAN